MFVSHSRKDAEGQLFLSHVFRLPESNYRPFFYSIGPHPPHARAIRDWIRRSEALVFLLSDQMLDPTEVVRANHTRAWVGYEVGIASQLGQPVVVIEPENHRVDLPVPGATHYIQRPAEVVGILPSVWAAIASSACSFSGEVVQGSPIDGSRPERREPRPGAVVGYNDFDTMKGLDIRPIVEAVESMGVFTRIRCPDRTCLAPFMLPRPLLNRDSFPCPSCRRDVLSKSAAALQVLERRPARGPPEFMTRDEFTTLLRQTGPR